MHTLHLEIFNSFYKVISNDSKVTERIALDFSYFITEVIPLTPTETIEILVQDPPWEIIPPLVAKKQTDTSIIYEEGNIRYNDYHGQALTTVNQKNKISVVYCQDLHLAHELGYLLILSKSGKEMDLKGFHKVHAMGLQLKGVNLIMISPSKGGKSTHFLELLSDPAFKIYSDDTPVVDGNGNIFAFPLRVGIEEGAEVPSYVDKNKTYELVRRKFGAKKLIPLTAMGREIAQFNKLQRTILVVGKRSRKHSPELRAVSNLTMAPFLIKYMIVGVGLPMILEYFLETGFKDILKRFKIIFKRSMAALNLMFCSEKYIFEMSSDIRANTSLIIELLKNEHG
jgi:hypothetical protein